MLILRSGFVVAKFSIEARQVNMRADWADFLFYGTPIFSNLPRPRKLRLNNKSHDHSCHKWLTKPTLYIFLQGRYKGIPCMCVLLEPPTMKAAIARYHVWPIALGGECSDLLAAKGEELNMKLQDTLPKFSSSPLNSYLPNRKGSSSNHHVFRGELLKFGGVSRWNRHLKHSVMLMMLVKWMFVVVDFVCQFLYPPKKWLPAFQIFVSSHLYWICGMWFIHFHIIAQYLHVLHLFICSPKTLVFASTLP